MKNLSVQEIIAHWKAGINVVDTRPPMEFAAGFLPGSLYVFPDQKFTLRLKSFLDISSPFIVVTSKDNFRIVSDFLKDGKLKNMEGVGIIEEEHLRKQSIPLDIVIDVNPDELGMDLKFDDKAEAIDLRSENEFDLEHIKGSVSLPLMELIDIAQVASLDDGQNIYFYAGNEGDAMTAASLLKIQELHQIRVVTGGWEEIKKETLIVLEKPAQNRKPGKQR